MERLVRHQIEEGQKDFETGGKWIVWDTRLFLSGSQKLVYASDLRRLTIQLLG